MIVRFELPMKYKLLFIWLLYSIFSTQTWGVSIKPVIQNGSTVYWVDSDNFNNENSALQLKFELSGRTDAKGL